MHNALTCIGIGGMAIYLLSCAPIRLGIRLYIVSTHANLYRHKSGTPRKLYIFQFVLVSNSAPCLKHERVKGHGNALYLGSNSARDFNSLVVLEVIKLGWKDTLQ